MTDPTRPTVADKEHNHELWKLAVQRTFGPGAVGYISPSPGPRWWAEEYPASATALYYHMLEEFGHD